LQPVARALALILILNTAFVQTSRKPIPNAIVLNRSWAELLPVRQQIKRQQQQRHKSNNMWCIVNLSNGTQQAVKWDPKANGQECLEKVSSSVL